MGNMEHFAWRAFFALFVDMEPATYIPNDYLLSLFYCFTLETIAMIDFPNLQSASWSASMIVKKMQLPLWDKIEMTRSSVTSAPKTLMIKEKDSCNTNDGRLERQFTT